MIIFEEPAGIKTKCQIARSSACQAAQYTRFYLGLIEQTLKAEEELIA